MPGWDNANRRGMTMASKGKKRKAQSIERRAQQVGQPPRPHPDGDRRRREFGQLAKEILQHKETQKRAWLDAPPED